MDDLLQDAFWPGKRKTSWIAIAFLRILRAMDIQKECCDANFPREGIVP